MAERVTKTRRHQSSKPQLERQRRARINNSLEELKSLVFSALYQDPDQYSQKMEKAEILEMAVSYLKMLRNQKMTGRECVTGRANDALCKYRAGFNDCTNRVIQFLKNEKDADLRLKENLLTHLASCCQFLQASSEPAPTYTKKGVQCVTMPCGVDRYYNINGVPYWPPTPPPSPTTSAFGGSLSLNETCSRGMPSSERHGYAFVETHAQIWRPWQSQRTIVLENNNKQDK